MTNWNFSFSVASKHWAYFFLTIITNYLIFIKCAIKCSIIFFIMILITIWTTKIVNFSQKTKSLFKFFSTILQSPLLHFFQKKFRNFAILQFAMTTTQEIDIKKYIFVKNAHLNNLKNIDVLIPKNKLIVITGVSGSGKS